MAAFKELDPDVARKLLEGYEDVLDDEAAKLEVFYRQFVCLAGCPDVLQKELTAQHVFADPDTLVPRALLRCPGCQLLFNPFSRVVLEAGKRIDINLPGAPR
jgi:hypothetical protein